MTTFVDQHIFGGAIVLLALGFILSLVHHLDPCAALENGLALTPPMGWNTYNFYKADINASIFIEAVDVFVSTPLQSVGYEYINSGSGWWYHINKTIVRNASGYMTYDPQRYPNGIQSMIAYVHAHGLKYGHWTDAGVASCNGDAPMSEGYEVQDIALFVEWQVDFLKVDGCNMEGNVTELALRWTRMLNYSASARNMVYSNSHVQCVNDPAYKYYDASMSTNASVSFFPACVNISNLWRVSTDLKATWASMLHNIDCVVGLGRYASPSAWNNPDMMQIGNAPDFVDDGSALHLRRNQAHFSLWCIVSAPLILGNNLNNMTHSILDVITNVDAINVNQGYNHGGGGGGDLVVEYDNITPQFKQEMLQQSMRNNNMTQVWYKTLASDLGNAAILFLNRDFNHHYAASVTFNDLPMVMNHSPNNMVTCDCFDIWTKEMVRKQNMLNVTLAPNSVRFVRLQNCTNTNTF